MSEQDEGSRGGPLTPNVNRGWPAPAAGHAGGLMPQPRSPHGNERGGITPAFVLFAIRQWWKWAVPAALLLTAASAGLVLASFKKQYEAVAWVRIQERTPIIAFETKTADASRAFQQTQVALIRSPVVLDAVVMDEGIRRLQEMQDLPESGDPKRPSEDRVRWLAKQLQVKFVEGSELLTVAYAGPDGEGAARIVNAIIDTYFKACDPNQFSRVEGMLVELKSQQKERDEFLRRLRERLRTTSKEATGKDPFAPVREADTAFRHPLADLQNRLIAAEVEQAMLQAKVTALENELNKEGPVPDAQPDAPADAAATPPVSLAEWKALEDLIDGRVRKDQELKDQQTQLAGKRAKYWELAAKSTDGCDDPACRQLAAEIEQEQEALHKLQNALRKEAVEQLAQEIRLVAVDQPVAPPAEATGGVPVNPSGTRKEWEVLQGLVGKRVTEDGEFQKQQGLLASKRTKGENTVQDEAKLHGLQHDLAEKAKEQLATELLITNRVDDDPELQRLQDLLASKKAECRQIEARSAKGHDDPGCKRLDAQIKQGEKSLDRLKEKLRKTAAEQLAAESKVPDAAVAKRVEENRELQQRKELLAAMNAKLKDTAAASIKGISDPACQQLAAEINQKQEAFRQFREELRKRARREIAEEMRIGMTGPRNQGTSAWAKELEDPKSRLARELADARRNLAAQQLAADLLKKRYEVEVNKVGQNRGDTVDLKLQQDELARAEKVYDAIADRITRLETELKAPPRVEISRRAVAPGSPIEEWPAKKMALAGLAAFGFPFLLAVGWERLMRRVSDADHLEQESRLTVIGEIANLPTRSLVARRRTSRRVGQQWLTFEESVDSLRTGLMLSESLRSMRTLAITSAVNHEGKTSVASQLTVSLARALCEPILLVDGDMRSPGVHKVFEVPLAPGLAEVLSGEVPLDQAIITSLTDWNNCVHVLPAGRLRTNPHRLVANGALRQLLGSVSASYRYVVIDTPPILAASESLVFGRSADVALLCAMRDVSRVDQVRKACERLVAAGGNVVGTVLNGVPTRQYLHRYGRYPVPKD